MKHQGYTPYKNCPVRCRNTVWTCPVPDTLEFFVKHARSASKSFNYCTTPYKNFPVRCRNTVWTCPVPGTLEFFVKHARSASKSFNNCEGQRLCFQYVLFTTHNQLWTRIVTCLSRIHFTRNHPSGHRMILTHSRIFLA